MSDHAGWLFLVAGLALAVVAASLGGTAAEDGLGSETFAQSEVDADRIVLDISLAENGSATWRVAYRVELRTDNETAAFESLRADIEANSTAYTSAFRERIERTAGIAENATGREMTIRGMDVSASTESVQGFGTVEYTFRWTNFGSVDGEQVRAGDALAGFFLEADSRLRVSWPEGYEASTLSPEPDDRRETSATWNGPLEFGSEGPQITVTSSGGLPWLLLAGVAVVLVGLAGGLWLVTNRDEEDGDEEAAPAAAGSDPKDSDDADDGGAVPDEELLSNEERVLRLLEARDGRVKQQQVKQEFDWTDAKTSQVVNTLKDEERIEVFRLGRENVLVLPEESDL